MADGNFQTNLRRLLFFHHRSAREAARALGTTERTVSQWLTGKRYPGAQALMMLDRRYGTSPRELDYDEVEFAQRLADRDRIEYARKALMVEAPRLQEHLKALSRTGADENVTPLRGKKK